MGVIDAHLHSEPGNVASVELLRRMNRIWVDGSGIFFTESGKPGAQKRLFLSL